MTPKFVELPEGELFSHHGHWVVDSALYGDVVAASRNIYAFGKFDMDQCKQIVQLAEPQNFAQRYTELNLEASDDPFGFLHIMESRDSMGKEIRAIDADGNLGV